MHRGSGSAAIHRTKRKNTTKACEECRQKRSKCNGEKPTCSRCADLGVTCHYAAREDGRQPAPKSYVILLRRRIQMLESTLKRHGINIQAAIDPLAHVPEVSNFKLSNQSRSATQAETSAAFHDDTDTINETLSSVLKGAFITDESLSFNADGEPRYFGSISGRPELSRNDELPSSPSAIGTKSSKSSNNRSNPIPKDPGLEIEILIPKELRNHLLDLYFDWQNPWHRVVDEALFRLSESYSGRYCSPLLLNSMFAMGSRFSDRTELRSDPGEPLSMGNIFLERAEALLPSDLKWPSVTTIQSLCIMSTVAIAHGSDASGWLYQGMAKTLALDMGLNIDPDDLSRSGILTAQEADLRRQLYWSIYCDDKLSALYTGRVCTMLSSQANVQMPFLDTGARSPTTQIENQLGYDVISPSHEYSSYMKAFVALCRILETILTDLYTPQSLNSRELGTSFLESCLLDLKNWSYDLPSEVKLDRTRMTSRPAYIFVLHMVYHTSYIIVANFFSAKQSARTWDLEGKLKAEDENLNTRQGHIAKTSWDAAREICAIAAGYRQKFGSFRQSPITPTHCILSAASVLLRTLRVDSQSSAPTASNDRMNLNVCLEVLDELSQSWHPAKGLRVHIMSKLSESSAQHGTNYTFSRTVSSMNAEGSCSGLVLRTMEGPDRNIAEPDFAPEVPFHEPDINQTDPEFDFNDFRFFQDDWEGLPQTSSLPLDYFNFDIANAWCENSGR